MAIEITDEVFEKIIPDLKAGAKEKDIYTLTKDGWILVCLIVYKDSGSIRSDCSLP